MENLTRVTYRLYITSTTAVIGNDFKPTKKWINQVSLLIRRSEHEADLWSEAICNSDDSLQLKK